jgi:thymidylate synthase (FAD)
LADIFDAHDAHDALCGAVPGGTIRMADYMGSDRAIIEAARQSTGGTARGWGTPESPSGDDRLLRHLLRSRHTGPFEFCEAVFEVRAPIFVARQWMRHRTQSYAEASGRYTGDMVLQPPTRTGPEGEVAPRDWAWVPPLDRFLGDPETKNKQARAAAAPNPGTVRDCQTIVENAYTEAWCAYQELVDRGVPLEVARTVLPVGTFTKFRAKANLHNWLKWLSLRNEGHAQREIRAYAVAVEDLLRRKFPRTIRTARDLGLIGSVGGE